MGAALLVCGALAVVLGAWAVIYLGGAWAAHRAALAAASVPVPPVDRLASLFGPIGLREPCRRCGLPFASHHGPCWPTDDEPVPYTVTAAGLEALQASKAQG